MNFELKTDLTFLFPGGAQICECLNKSTSCSKCEVDCTSDCNDKTRAKNKCFSKLACSPILFEEDCDNKGRLDKPTVSGKLTLSNLGDFYK